MRLVERVSLSEMNSIALSRIEMNKIISASVAVDVIKSAIHVDSK